MPLWQVVGLALAAFAAGALNAVAGGGTFLTFPALYASGIGAKVANATSTVALWPGSVASAIGYRDAVRHSHRLLWALASVSAVGGLAGAVLLLRTPETTFKHLIPWLLLTATLVFAFGGQATRRLRRQPHPHVRSPTALVALVVAQLAVAVYGGYFGAGIGILMLASFAAFGMEDLHAMNGLKTMLGSVINAVAIVAFVAARAIAWPVALPMVVGSVLGGYGAARYARRVPPAVLRGIVIATGATLTAVYFAKEWL